MAMVSIFSNRNISVFVLLPLLFPSRGSTMWDLSSECKTNQTHFTNWISFLPSNFREEINPTPEALGLNT